MWEADAVYNHMVGDVYGEWRTHVELGTKTKIINYNYIIKNTEVQLDVIRKIQS